MAITLQCSVFSEGEMIPKKFTCDGDDVSPALSWEGVPPETKSIALFLDDPDAPGGLWVHWVLFNLPGSVRELPEAVPTQKILANGAKQGLNDFRRIGYGGPCPPRGTTHRYYFKIYALDLVLGLQAAATKAQVEAALKGHILAEARLMGRYHH